MGNDGSSNVRAWQRVLQNGARTIRINSIQLIELWLKIADDIWCTMRAEIKMKVSEQMVLYESI